MNPYALTLRRAELLQQKRIKEGKAKTIKKARQSNKQKNANFARINADGLPEVAVEPVAAAEK